MIVSGNSVDLSGSRTLEPGPPLAPRRVPQVLHQDRTVDGRTLGMRIERGWAVEALVGLERVEIRLGGSVDSTGLERPSLELLSRLATPHEVFTQSDPSMRPA